MIKKISLGQKIFSFCNYVFLIIMALLCIAPFIHVLAMSLSNATAVLAGEVKFWPVGLNVESYKFVAGKPEFLNALFISIKRAGLGLTVNLLLNVLIAYPLSKEVEKFKWRTFYAWFFIITILFYGGLIPWYITIEKMGLINSIWALVLPCAVPVFNIVILLNFFRGLPKEIEEAAFIDGAGHWQILWKIFVPLSKPAIATLTLFSLVFHWNSWFDGMILMNTPSNYPLQTYLMNVIVETDLSLLSATDIEMLSMINDRTSRAAQIFIGALPILAVYPFLQKYFTKGLVLGSVKG